MGSNKDHDMESATETVRNYFLTLKEREQSIQVSEHSV
jgi:hypothetical protein